MLWSLSSRAYTEKNKMGNARVGGVSHALQLIETNLFKGKLQLAKLDKLSSVYPANWLGYMYLTILELVKLPQASDKAKDTAGF